MTTNKKHLPFKISEYIKKYFREDFLFDVKEVKELKGHLYYTVEVSKDNYIHTLRFNENGDVMKDEAEEAFPPDVN